MLQPVASCALDCCECGAVVGTEGPQRGTLLLPCQHVLHMGCVEFIKRRGKLLMGMDTADVVQDECEASFGALSSSTTTSSLSATASSASWARQMHGRCLCPACYASITHIIPLFLRSEDDPGATSKNAPTESSGTTTGAASALNIEEHYKRVHPAHKRLLLPLRALCEQRRPMTELTHACASLHERRARYLADVEKEERCFPGLISGAEQEGGTRATAAAGAGGLPLEQMGITELELYMAQVTPRLLRTQAEVRKERQLVERRVKKLSVLRSHYHSTKELHALDAEIAERQAPMRGGASRSAAAHLSDSASTPRHEQPHHQKQPDLTVRSTEPQRQPSSALESLPARKKPRSEEAIDVDDASPPAVVEILSNEISDAEEPEVTVVDEDDSDADTTEATKVQTVEEDGFDSGVEFMERVGNGADAASSYAAPYLIPCYVRTSTSSTASSAVVAEPKTPRMTLTHNHVRMLPRREDRLWQPSLQF